MQERDGQVIRPKPTVLQSLSEIQMSQLERHLVRKLDLRLMAPLIVIYIMNYLDVSAFCRRPVISTNNSHRGTQSPRRKLQALSTTFN